MHNTKVLMLQDLIKKALAMLLFMMLARFLTTEEFGKYQQVILVSSLLAMIFSGGIPVSVSYFYGQAKSFTKQISIFKGLFFLQLTILSLGAFLLFLFKSELANIFSNEYLDDMIVVMILIMISTSFLEYFKHLSVVSKRLNSYFRITSLIQLSAVLLSVLTIFFTQNIYYILVIAAVAGVIQSLFLIKINLKYFLPSFNFVLISTIEYKYILAMASVGLIGVLNGFVDQLMVSIMLNVSDYAMLKIGAFQIPIISIVTGSLLTAMIPLLSKMYKDNKIEDIIKTWSKSIEKATVLLIPIIIFCLVFAQEIIISFFGSKYEPSVIIFQTYMFQWLRAVVIFGGVMGAIGLEKELFKNTMFMTFLNIVINYVMILNFGIIGAALTTTVLNYFGAVLLIRVIDNKLNRSFVDYFPFRVYLISLFLSLMLSLVAKYLLADMSITIVGLIIISALFYLAVLVIQMKIFYNDISVERFKALV